MPRGLRINRSNVLTKLEPVTIVSLELRNKQQFSIHVESDAARGLDSADTHTGVVWKSKALLTPLS